MGERWVCEHAHFFVHFIFHLNLTFAVLNKVISFDIIQSKVNLQMYNELATVNEVFRFLKKSSSLNIISFPDGASSTCTSKRTSVNDVADEWDFLMTAK